MKTPEELAERYAKKLRSSLVQIAAIYSGIERIFNYENMKDAFLAGYQAAKDQLFEETGFRLKLFKDEADAKAAYQEALEENESDKAYHQGLKDGAPQWISVKDRLPELMSRCENRSYSDDVLWLTKTGEMVVGNCRKVNEHISVLIPVGEPLITNFTHWMPLPKPPEEV